VGLPGASLLLSRLFEFRVIDPSILRLICLHCLGRFRRRNTVSRVLGLAEDLLNRLPLNELVVNGLEVEAAIDCAASAR
jgi:uncharacterized membrane protein